jgi:transposase-like protein
MLSLCDGSGRRHGGETRISFKGTHFVKEVILTCARWYLAYPLSYRQAEELMEEHGVSVDHATINRWVLKYSPQLEAVFHHRKRPIGRSWRIDETYIKVKGEWRYLYRAVDKTGHTVDFLLTEQRDEPAALRFRTKAISRHGLPETITIDGSEANAAAIRRYNADHRTAIVIRQVKYLNNIIEIVFTHLTKTGHLAARVGGDGVADFLCVPKMVFPDTGPQSLDTPVKTGQNLLAKRCRISGVYENRPSGFF